MDDKSYSVSLNDDVQVFDAYHNAIDDFEEKAEKLSLAKAIENQTAKKSAKKELEEAVGQAGLKPREQAKEIRNKI